MRQIAVVHRAVRRQWPASGERTGVRVLIAILVFWTAALFFGTGLYAEPNALVYAALAFGALSIALAIFLIFEFGMPFTMIVALARKLLIVLWRFATIGETRAGLLLRPAA